MEPNYKLSHSSILFLSKFKEFLDSIAFQFDEFFLNFQTINQKQLSKLEFFRILGLIHIETINNFNSQKTFDELSKNQFTIILSYFKTLLSNLQMIKKSSSSQSNDNKKQEEMKKRIIQIGLMKLSKFMHINPDPLGFLRTFDSDDNNSMSKQQFNTFLVATDIRQLSNKDIRRVIIEHIYKYFPNREEITMKELATLFKIQYKEPNYVNLPHNQEIGNALQNFFNTDLKNNHPHQKHNLNPYQNPYQMPNHHVPHQIDPFKKKNQNVTHNNIIPNINNNSNPYLLKPENNLKPNQTFSNPNQNPNIVISQEKPNDYQISNCDKMFPKAMRYYRLGDPNPNQFQVMQELQNLLSSKKEFVDKENPALHEGVYKSSREIFQADYHIFQMASSVLVRQVSRIGIARMIQPKDIIQGSVGDCYFLSSIASIISIYPQLISQLFLFSENNSNFYAVKLFIDGEWKIIKTDDRFPCTSNSPLYAKPHGKEIWVMLLEKCWAKVFGSYRSIESGSSKEGFLALTGAPCDNISHGKDKSESEFIKELQDAHKKKYVATMSGSDHLDSLGKNGQENLGLISGHAYSLLKIIKLSNEVTLIKIRNPWGKTIWKGAWSFGSKEWTKQLKDKYNYNRNPEDGSFYMPLKQFLKYFGEVVICKINTTFVQSSLSVKSGRNKSVYLSMVIKTKGQYIISIYQQSKRKFKNKYQNYDFSVARIIILRKNGDKFTYAGARATSQRIACSVDLYLQAGEYIISAKVQFKFWDSHQFVINSYGVDHTTLKTINRVIAPQFKAGMISSYSKMMAGTGKMKSYEKYGFNATCQTNFNIETGIGFIRMVNSSNKEYQSTQEVTGKGIKVIKPDRAPLVFKMGANSQRTYGFFVKASGYEYSNSEKIVYH